MKTLQTNTKMMNGKDIAEERKESLRLETLHQARQVRALIRERHGSFSEGEAARAVREGREFAKQAWGHIP